MVEDYQKGLQSWRQLWRLISLFGIALHQQAVHRCLAWRTQCRGPRPTATAWYCKTWLASLVSRAIGHHQQGFVQVKWTCTYLCLDVKQGGLLQCGDCFAEQLCLLHCRNAFALPVYCSAITPLHCRYAFALPLRLCTAAMPLHCRYAFALPLSLCTAATPLHCC